MFLHIAYKSTVHVMLCHHHLMYRGLGTFVQYAGVVYMLVRESLMNFPFGVSLEHHIDTRALECAVPLFNHADAIIHAGMAVVRYFILLHLCT